MGVDDAGSTTPKSQFAGEDANSAGAGKKSTTSCKSEEEAVSAGIGIGVDGLIGGEVDGGVGGRCGGGGRGGEGEERFVVVGTV